MNAQQLQKPDGTPVDSWFCGECGQLMGDREYAERHCTEGKCCYCQQPCGKGNYYHDGCRLNDYFEKAEKLTVWDGWVFLDDCGHRDGYFTDAGDFVEWWQQTRKEPLPQFVFIAEPQEFPGLNLDDVLESMCDEMYEEARLHLEGEDELQVAVDKFNEANAGNGGYMYNEKRVLLLGA